MEEPGRLAPDTSNLGRLGADGRGTAAGLRGPPHGRGVLTCPARLASLAPEVLHYAQVTLDLRHEGLDWIDSIGIETIHLRAQALTGWLLDQARTLFHRNGRPVVRVYGPLDLQDRGATVAVNVLDPSGAVWDCWYIESLANERKLSLRSGCHCNPGAREVALGYPRPLLAECFKDKEHKSWERFMHDSRDCRAGVVRISFGLASNFDDVHHVVDFLRSFADRVASADQRAVFSVQPCQGCRRWRSRTETAP